MVDGRYRVDIWANIEIKVKKMSVYAVLSTEQIAHYRCGPPSILYWHLR